MPAAPLSQKIRNRQQAVGYWIMQDSPFATERLARVGYDYMVLDGQHGFIGFQGLLTGLLAIDAGGVSAGLVRVGANDPAVICQALDAGATGVIVPMVDTPGEAADAVAAVRYPPQGRRSYGPTRSVLRTGPATAVANDANLVLAMIETADGLRNVEAICATEGLDGVYVGPSDLRLGLGGESPTDPALHEEFERALVRIREAAAAAGLAAGIHTADGATAARRLAEGYTFATVASDVAHLERAATDHLEAARGGLSTFPEANA